VSPRPRLRRRLGIVAATIFALHAGVAAQPAKPNYLGYEEFSPRDTPERIAAKGEFNQAAQRYNQALYEYHVTLERHDRLVEIHNDGATDPAERKKAREEAEALRAKLGELRREVTTRAAKVDEARRRAAALGLSITR
jgi:hypothetical protein